MCKAGQVLRLRAFEMYIRNLRRSAAAKDGLRSPGPRLGLARRRIVTQARTGPGDSETKAGARVT